jgi:hypothetical protein
VLEAAQHHDLDEAADVKARRGRVEPDIAGHHLLGGHGIEAARVGHLVDVAPLVEQAQKIGCVGAHGAPPYQREAATGSGLPETRGSGTLARCTR